MRACVSILRAAGAEKGLFVARTASKILEVESFSASGACHIRETDTASHEDLGAGLAGDVEGAFDQIEVVDA